ncbi:hypothetical protein E4U38_007556 [Claviceps purpurea]|nr:hypothetical protein E4U38_007556 [Claviceps purpurea]KAG6222394.1 hypothetical protein E4U26_005301 [Claviceps purpurea]
MAILVTPRTYGTQSRCRVRALEHACTYQPFAIAHALTYTDEDQTAYFRGRKLIGKCARLPEKYEGAIVRIENEGERRKKNSSEISSVKNDPDAELPAGESIHITSTFNEICTWTQGSISSDFDQYAKCVDEWFSIADRVSFLNPLTATSNPNSHHQVEHVTSNLSAERSAKRAWHLSELDICVVGFSGIKLAPWIPRNLQA